MTNENQGFISAARATFERIINLEAPKPAEAPTTDFSFNADEVSTIISALLKASADNVEDARAFSVLSKIVDTWME